MPESPLLERITSRQDVFAGKPIIRGMRISVELILSLLAQGESSAEILADYPDLEGEDIRACIAYALETSLSVKRKVSLQEFLLTMPNVGEDADFERSDDRGRF